MCDNQSMNNVRNRYFRDNDTVHWHVDNDGAVYFWGSFMWVKSSIITEQDIMNMSDLTEVPRDLFSK